MIRSYVRRDVASYVICCYSRRSYIMQSSLCKQQCYSYGMKRWNHTSSYMDDEQDDLVRGAVSCSGRSYVETDVCYVLECPVCGEKGSLGQSASNMTWHVMKTHGEFLCTSCEASGDLKDFQSMLDLGSGSETSSLEDTFRCQPLRIANNNWRSAGLSVKAMMDLRVDVIARASANIKKRTQLGVQWPTKGLELSLFPKEVLDYYRVGLASQDMVNAVHGGKKIVYQSVEQTCKTIDLNCLSDIYTAAAAAADDGDDDRNIDIKKEKALAKRFLFGGHDKSESLLGVDDSRATVEFKAFCEETELPLFASFPLYWPGGSVDRNELCVGYEFGNITNGSLNGISWDALPDSDITNMKKHRRYKWGMFGGHLLRNPTSISSKNSPVQMHIDWREDIDVQRIVDANPDECIIVTVHPIDALAMFYATGIAAVALPRIKGRSSLPSMFVPYFEGYKKIFLCKYPFSLDKKSRYTFGINTARFTNSLGRSRVFFPNPKPSKSGFLSAPESPMAMLAKSTSRSSKPEVKLARMSSNALSILAMLQNVSETSSGSIRPIGYYSEEALELLLGKTRSSSGVMLDSFPLFSRLLQGLRRGELTIFSGPTGTGKTSVLTQMSVDYARQDVHTLWGSFEMPPHQIYAKMICYQSQKNFKQMSRQLGRENVYDDIVAADKVVRQLPISFVDTKDTGGRVDLKWMISTLRTAVYTNDVEHIILDNLQYMLSSSTSKDDRLELQDHCITELRSFATNFDVHITVVVHPKKTNTPLDSSALYGPVRTSQEADNIIVINGKIDEEGENATRLELLKNRFDGTIGRVYYEFDVEKQTFSEIPDAKCKENAAVRERLESKGLFCNSDGKGGLSKMLDKNNSSSDLIYEESFS